MNARYFKASDICLVHILRSKIFVDTWDIQPFVRQTKFKSRPKNYSIKSHILNGAPIFRFCSTNKSLNVPGVKNVLRRYVILYDSHSYVADGTPLSFYLINLLLM